MQIEMKYPIVIPILQMSILFAFMHYITGSRAKESNEKEPNLITSKYALSVTPTNQ